MANLNDRESSWRSKSLFKSTMQSSSFEMHDAKGSAGTPRTSAGTPRTSAGTSRMSWKPANLTSANPSLYGTSFQDTSESRAAIVAPLEEARFAATVLRAAGASTAHARLVASALAAADVRGKTRHGLLTLPEILSAVSRGDVDARAAPALVNDAPALAWVDGGEALGPVVGHYCMTLALYKAQVLGLGIVFCRSNTDIGFPGWYSSMAQKKNMIGLCFTSIHDKPVTMTGAAAGDADLALNRMSASAPCSDANNFELQLSWRLALPPQSLTPRLPAELRRATSSDLLLQDDHRPPPGACGHDPRKGFLAALAVEGLCGFVGGLRYDAHLRASASKMEPYRTLVSGSFGESKEDTSPTEDSPPLRSPLVSILNKKGQGRESADSTGSPDSPDSPEGLTWGNESPEGVSGGGSPREIVCSQTPPSDVSAIDECACAEGEPPRVITPTPHRPPDPTVRCVPAGKAKRSSRPKRVTLDVNKSTTGEISPLPPGSKTEETEEEGESFSPEKSPSFLEKEPPASQVMPPESPGEGGLGSRGSSESPEGQGQYSNDPYDQAQSAHCFIAVDPDSMESGFPLRLGGFMRHMTSQEPLDPAKPVMVPGDPERMCILRAQRQGGVRFYIDDVHHLNDLAHRLGVAPLRFKHDVECSWWREN